MELEKNQKEQNVSNEFEPISIGSTTIMVEKTAIEPTIEILRSISNGEYKLANQPGVVGLTMAIVFPLYKFVLNVNLAVINFEDFIPKRGGQNSILFRELVFFFSVALVFSIIGTSRSSHKYQKGIAIAGLILNILFLLNMIIECFSSGGGGVEMGNIRLH